MALHAPGQVSPSATGVAVTVPAPLPTSAVVTVKVTGENDAVTDAAAARVSVQVAWLPVQAPVHPVKLLPASALAVSVTWLPSSKLAVQVAPQLMPAGVEVTVPAPVVATVSVTGMAASGSIASGGSTVPSTPASGAIGASEIGGVTWPHAATAAMTKDRRYGRMSPG